MSKSNRSGKVVGWLSIPWILLAVANLLFVNVYNNHLGLLDNHIRIYGFFLLTLALLLIATFHWLASATRHGGRIRTLLAVLPMSLILIAAVALTVYTFVTDGDFIVMAANHLAGWLSAINF